MAMQPKGAAALAIAICGVLFLINVGPAGTLASSPIRASAEPDGPLSKTLARCLDDVESCREQRFQPQPSPLALLSKPRAALHANAGNPAQAGIHGKITYRGAPAPNVDLTLRRYRAGSAEETSVLTVTTAADGAYLFADVPNLPSGMRYYVRFWNAAGDDLFIANWYAPDIPLYAAGQSTPGGDFDVSDVVLRAPAPGAKRSLPVQFSWQKRLVATDSYRLRLSSLDLAVRTDSEDLGYVDGHSLSELPEGLPYDTPNWWSINVYAAPDSFGTALYRRQITVLSITATPAVTATPSPSATPAATATPTATSTPVRPKIFMPGLHKDQ